MNRLTFESSRKDGTHYTLLYNDKGELHELTGEGPMTDVDHEMVLSTLRGQRSDYNASRLR